jgi:acyl-CoA synthetase (AMP-forming)/AMP-acid ligase II
MLSLNSDCYNEYLLAVPWANAVLNPVNFRWRVHEIAYCLRDSGSRVLLVDEHHAGMVPALREAVPGLETVIGVATGGLEGMVDYEELAESAARPQEPEPAQQVHPIRTDGRLGPPRCLQVKEKRPRRADSRPARIDQPERLPPVPRSDELPG